MQALAAKSIDSAPQESRMLRNCVQSDRQVIGFRRQISRISPWVAALALAISGSGAATAQSLRGSVRDPQGQPLPGSEVIVRNALDGEERRTIAGEDGAFAIDNLDAGVYDVESALEGFTVAPRSGILLQSGESLELGMEAQPGVWEALGMGEVSAESDPLRSMFEESTLVVIGTAGRSVSIDSDDPSVLATELSLTLVLKGREARRTLKIYHGAPDERGVGALAPGTRILAFLKLQSILNAERAYEPTDETFGLKTLSEAELSAYRERIESLEKLPRDPQPHPGDLVEWLVATAEEPLTRNAAAVEILEAQDALGDLARQRGTSVEQAALDLKTIVSRRLAFGKGLESAPSSAMIAAFLSDEQRERLGRALQNSPTLDRADLTLYEIVKSWDRQAALSWFVQQLREVDPATTEGSPADLGVQIMDALAKELGNVGLQTLVKGAQDQLIEIYSDPTSFGSDPALRLRESREAAVATKLLRDYRQALAVLQ